MDSLNTGWMRRKLIQPACYNCHQERKKVSRPKRVWSKWNLLPALILEVIYSYLTVQQRYRCSRVCKNWYSAFSYPKAWRRFTVTPTAFLNHHQISYLRTTCHYRVERCLAQVGHQIRFLEVLPFPICFNLAGFLSVLSNFFISFEDYPMPNLRGFGLTFDCEIRIGYDLHILGAHKLLLEVLRMLFWRVQSLKYLKLNQVLLQDGDDIHVFDGLAGTCRTTMERIEILNYTKTSYPLSVLASFSNLSHLTITPNNITEDVLLFLLRYTKLRHLVLVQDKYTELIEDLDVIPSSVWADIKRYYPELKVDLEYRGEAESDVLIQPGAPVKKITYKTTKSNIMTETIFSIIGSYKFSLCSYIHLQLPRQYSSRSFNERADSTIVMMIRECPNIETLILNCKLSTCTVLVIAMEAKRLKTFCVRRNATLLRRDWTKCRYWSDAQYTWLMKSSRDYTVVEQEVGRLLGTQWGFLSDKEFKGLSAE